MRLIKRVRRQRQDSKHEIDNGDSDQGDNNNRHRYIFKVMQIGFPKELGMRYGRKRGINDDLKKFGQKS